MSEPDRPRRRFHELSIVKSWQAAAGIGGFVVAVVGVTATLVLAGAGEDEADSPPPTASAQVSTADVGPTGPIAVGTCLDGDDRPTGCGNSHLGEVVHVGPDCSGVDLVGYLGGLTELDVLGSQVLVQPVSVESIPACAVLPPDGMPRRGSVEDVLLGPDDDPWRRCLDERAAREVNCASPHTAEIVSLVGTDAAACSSRADDYAGTPLARFSFELVVGPVQTSGAEECRIAVRGSSVLTASVRGLGSTALPLEAD